MRILFTILSAAITVMLCYTLNTNTLLPAPLGKLLAPQQGVWQNAEPVDVNFNEQIKLKGLQGAVEVQFNERLVPHIFAEYENDAYFVQGYLHAKFRLWQMDFQTLAAAGRISEIVGEKALPHDREFRRLGMVYAAEKTLEVMEADPVLKAQCDAYTAGVNARIEELTESSLPLEYKLIGYYPERWSNLKTALFLKYMSYDLAARENDFELTNALSYFGREDYRLLFPLHQDSLDPIVPGMFNNDSALKVMAPVSYDTLTPQETLVQVYDKPAPETGSNNWVIAPSKSTTGGPILCNDPHLGLNLPSLWYEIQITTPEFSTYGVSFPGSPAVIIGFNDSIAWGVTNGGRDVRDYYTIEFKDETKNEYLFNGEYLKTSFRYERIRIKDKPDYIDTVPYTVHGPVMYEASHQPRGQGDRAWAVRWTAHDPGKELKTFNLLNRAKNYDDFSEAVQYMQTPGQNFVFASRSGNIGIKTQGKWPAKWKEQGDFLMPGKDSTFMWKGFIPDALTPAQFNPERGFVSSGNQKPADSTYPYYLGMDYPLTRGRIINRMLNEITLAGVEDMKKMQTDNYNIFAEMAMPILMKYIQPQELTAEMQTYYQKLKEWDMRNEPDAEGMTIFELVWEAMNAVVYDDEYKDAPKVVARPFNTTLLEALLKDSAYKFIDNIETRRHETLEEIATEAFRKAYPKIAEADAGERLAWSKFKDTRVMHLARLEPFSRLHLPIGGGKHIINATTTTHGPSWRMIVSMGPQIEAYGVFPGGQQGNPGSRFYDWSVDSWVKGEYHPLKIINRSTERDPSIRWTMHFKPE
ncbi:MAG TPA: penicillin acylase family protein [Chitinophagaceae bacterium]|nr:penicillin acylase family protein [Chitinophagaceae bacterium]HML57151.1 penicillin acylase family protein [Ferruginibacter sp.]